MTIPLSVLFVLASLPAFAAGPASDFRAAVAEAQAKPGDRALAEKVIVASLKVKPAPSIPLEAKKPFVMAATYQKEAKSPSDYGLAIDAYHDALKAAPWWGDAYYNLSVALEAAGKLDEAKAALELYLLTKPKETEDAQNRLFALEAKTKLAAKQAADAAAEKAKAAQSPEGEWNNGMMGFTVYRDGDHLAIKPGIFFGRYGTWNPSETLVEGRTVRFAVNQPACPQCLSRLDLNLSADGSTLDGKIWNADQGWTTSGSYHRVGGK